MNSPFLTLPVPNQNILEIIGPICIKHKIALFADATQGEFSKYMGGVTRI
jgi:hypothetical protein